MNLQTNSGAPGGGIQMQVRGNSTLLGGFDPLFVVDGVIYSNASIPSGRGLANAAASPDLETDAVNRIADLNPVDIASIEVLKGAAASSIYGSKAANGVVVITTVRGQAGAPRFNLTQRVGVATPLRLLESRRAGHVREVQPRAGREAPGPPRDLRGLHRLLGRGENGNGLVVRDDGRASGLARDRRELRLHGRGR